jgi:hypothetical protein
MPELTERDVLLMLGRIEGKLDSVIGQQLNIIADQKIIEDRLEALENNRSFIYGIAATISALTGIAAAFVYKWLWPHG